jgi:hypothetical protein
MTGPARKIRWRGVGEYRDEAEPLLEHPGDVARVYRGRPRSLLMACPDGCGDTLVINLDDRAGKAWLLDERRGKLSLFPSVWPEDGCRSHFILWSDHLIWIGRFEAGNDEPAYDAALEKRALALLKRERFQEGFEIARQLDEISWDVIRALRRLVTKGRAAEGTGHRPGNFRRCADGKAVASS